MKRIHCHKDKFEKVGSWHMEKHSFHCLSTGFHLEQKRSRHRKTVLTTSLRGLEDHSQKFRHWHSTETGGGSGSDVELRSDPTITSGPGTDVDDESWVESKFTIISATKSAVNILHTIDKLVSYRVIKRCGLTHLLKCIDEWRENGASEISVRVYKYLFELVMK